MNLKALSLVAAAAAVTLGPSAGARAEDGNWIARVRAIYLDPANQNDAVPNLVPKDSIEVSSKWAPDIDFEYLVRNNFGIELLLTIPQEHSVSLPGVTLGKLKELPPTLTAKYYFMTERIRPYVGAGLNYTHFSSVDFAPLEAALGGASVDVSRASFGPALQAGADFMLNRHWLLSLDVKKIWMSTDVKVNGSKVMTENVDPWVYGVGFGYRFGG